MGNRAGKIRFCVRVKKRLWLLLPGLSIVWSKTMAKQVIKLFFCCHRCCCRRCCHCRLRRRQNSTSFWEGGETNWKWQRWHLFPHLAKSSIQSLKSRRIKIKSNLAAGTLLMLPPRLEAVSRQMLEARIDARTLCLLPSRNEKRL